MRNWLIIACAFAVLAMLMAVPAYADTGKPSVAVSGVTASPTVFMPGDTGTITVTLTNPQRSLAGDTTQDSNTYNFGTGTSGSTSIGHSQTTTKTSTNAPDGAVSLNSVSLEADGPIHVISKEFNDVGRLGMGDSAKFTFIVKVDDSAADTTYYLTLKVRTDDGDIYLNYPIAIQVDGTPLKIYVDEAPQSFSAAKQSVTLDIMNDRPNDVSSVSVVPSGDGYAFQPQQQYIIGSMGAGQMYIAQVQVSSKNASNSLGPGFKVMYKNGDNWHESAPVTVNVDGTVAPVTRDGGGNGMLYVLWILAVAAVALGGIYWYMRSKRVKQ